MYKKRTNKNQNKKGPSTSNSFRVVNKLSENENEPAKAAGRASQEQPWTSKKQQDKIQLEAFLKHQTPIHAGDNSALKDKG